MRFVEPLAAAIVTSRRIGVVPVVLRAVVALATVTALLATALASWDVPNAYVVVAALFALAWSLAPDSPAGLAFLAVLGMAWLTGSPGDLDPAVLTTALALLVAHVAAALAASMPVTARADAAMLGRWAVPTAGIAVATIAAAVVVQAFDAWSPTGSLAVTIAALALVTAGVWWWSATPDRDDPAEP